METVQVMPWGKDQGDFVVLNKADFDPQVHKLYAPKPKAEPKPAAKQKD